MLLKLQMWLFSKGAEKRFCIWDRLGNLVQDIRNILGA
jgi:hypothetical protein